jgi:hypothetical protein
MIRTSKRYMNSIPFVLNNDIRVRSCTVTVSRIHEPNVIMKDNDLKYKIRLPRSLSKEFIVQIENDANFLYGVGVMDYSLLGTFPFRALLW